MIKANEQEKSDRDWKKDRECGKCGDQNQEWKCDQDRNGAKSLIARIMASHTKLNRDFWN